MLEIIYATIQRSSDWVECNATIPGDYHFFQHILRQNCENVNLICLWKQWFNQSNNTFILKATFWWIRGAEPSACPDHCTCYAYHLWVGIICFYSLCNFKYTACVDLLLRCCKWSVQIQCELLASQSFVSEYECCKESKEKFQLKIWSRIHKAVLST